MEQGTAIDLSQNRWIYVFGGLNRKEKSRLLRYYDKVFPRDYAKKIVAAIGPTDVQHKTAQIKQCRRSDTE